MTRGLLSYFYSEIEKIADSLDYEHYESEGNARREYNAWNPLDNPQSENHEVDSKEMKKLLKRKMKSKKKLLKKEDEQVRITTNNGTEYEEDDPERESYNEVKLAAVKKGNYKISIQDLIR